MKKPLSIILIALLILALPACKDKNNDKNQQGNNNNNLLVDENANANQKKIMRTTFCYNLSRRPNGYVLPEGYHELPEEKQKVEFLAAYAGNTSYFDNIELAENAKTIMRARSYLIIDDIDTLSAVLATTGTYTLNDIYPLNILNNHFIIAVCRNSLSPATNGSLYSVEFDEASKILNIKQTPYLAGYVSGNTMALDSYALDLVPIERSVLNGVDLDEISATFTVLEQSYEITEN